MKVEDQYFNLMSALADSCMDMTDAEVEEEREDHVIPENRCAYLCGPHLEQCAKEKYHRGDCYCVQGGSLMRCIAAQAILRAKWTNPPN